MKISNEQEYSDEINEMEKAIEELEKEKIAMEDAFKKFSGLKRDFIRADDRKRGRVELSQSKYDSHQDEPVNKTDEEDHFRPGKLVETPAYHPMDAPCFENTYRIEKCLGKGGEARCFEVLDVETGTKYAMKVLKLKECQLSAACNFLHKEHFILKDLNHKNILKCIDGFKSSDNYFILSEICNKGSLEEVLSRFVDNQNEMGEKEQKEHEERVIKYAKQIIEGLIYLHGKGIIHNDIKPANIFIDDDDNIRIGDFGISETAPADGMVLTDGQGSLRYMAPENVKGFREKHSFSADTWALGVILYDLLTGNGYRYIFDTGVIDASIRIQGVPKELSSDCYYFEKTDIAPEWKSLILNILSLDPKKRPKLKEIHEIISGIHIKYE